MKIKQINMAIVASVLLASTAGALVIELDKVKVQYLDESELPTTLLEHGELCIITNDYTLYIGDGVTTGGVAIGYSNILDINTLMGATNVVDIYSVALGYQANAGGAQSVSLGGVSSVTAGFGVSVGYGAISGNSSTAIGAGATASGGNSVTVGDATASGDQSTAIGYNAVSSGFGSMQLGEGANSGVFTLQFRDYQLVTSSGAIPAARLTNTLDSIYAPLALATKTTATNYVVGTDNPNEAYGGMVLVTGTSTQTLPASEVGMSVTIKSRGAVTVSVNPAGTETIYLDGASVGAGDEVDNTGATGEVATFVCLTAGEWDVTSDGWIDGGP